MAGRRKKFVRSVKDSDFLYDLPCSPCEKDGKNVEATKYCTDCHENLCPTCLVNHNKFALMRGHKVLDQVQTSQGQTQQLPSQRCHKHGGKIIDVFCPKHDYVGCSTCISVDHSSCEGKKFIPDVAGGYKASREVRKLEAEMKTLMTKLDSLKKLKGDNLQRLKQDKDALKKQIQTVRKKMNEQLDNMEKELLQEAETRFKEKIDAIHASICEVDGLLLKIKQAMDEVKSGNNDADIFIYCKMAKLEISREILPTHARYDEQPDERSLELHTSEATNLIMEGRRMFASIEEKYNIQDAVYEGDIDTRVDTDRKECYISAMCARPDGCLVLVDFRNKNLKKLEPVSNNVSTLINLPDHSVGICLVDNTRLAVSLHTQKKIQFVSLSGQVKLAHSFTVGEKCRDVAHCDGLLYVCCGGSPEEKDKEGRGHLEVYNCTGDLLRCLYEEFGLPVYISVINDGNNTTLYTSDGYKGVQVRDTDGVIKHRYPTVLNTDLPFCLIGTDQVCTGELSTGNIYIHNKSAKHILINHRDLKGEPYCLYFDKISSRLYVVVVVNKVTITQVFQLKM